jgi:hypothetical protein
MFFIFYFVLECPCRALGLTIEHRGQVPLQGQPHQVEQYHQDQHQQILEAQKI